MIYAVYIVVFLLGYVLQTTLLSSWPLRPELMLVLFCLFWSGRSYRALWCGLLSGFLLDVFNGYSFYNTVLYTLIGSLCGFMPVSIFRDFRSLALVNLLISSVFLNIGYAILSKIFSGKFILLHPLQYPVLLILNVLFFYVIYWLFWRSKHER